MSDLHSGSSARDPDLTRSGGAGRGVGRISGTGSRTTIGLTVGLVLGVVAAFGGFGAFLTVAVLGAIGLLVGLVLDGRIDLAALIGRVTERR